MKVIITGAASGIGRACAELLGEGAIPGTHQMLLPDRAPANLEIVTTATTPAAPRARCHHPKQRAPAHADAPAPHGGGPRRHPPKPRLARTPRPPQAPPRT